MQPRVWGPPTWRLLHALGHCARRGLLHPKDLWPMADLLKEVLPCSLCRESYTTMQGTNAALSARRAADDFEGFVYVLHNLVNTKLHKCQGPSLDTVRTVCAAFDAIPGQAAVSCADVWLVLFVFGCCADALKGTDSTECTARRAAFIAFATMLGVALKALPYKPLRHLGRRLHRAFRHATDATPVTQALSVASRVPWTTVVQVGDRARVRPPPTPFIL
jgi:hypothetical protein